MISVKATSKRDFFLGDKFYKKGEYSMRAGIYPNKSKYLDRYYLLISFYGLFGAYRWDIRSFFINWDILEYKNEDSDDYNSVFVEYMRNHKIEYILND